MAAGGDGLAFIELNGKRRAVFVSDSAPGDCVKLTIDPSARTLRGTPDAIVSSGAARVAPECPHATECGGCNWMHLSFDAQSAIIPALLRSAIPNAPSIRFHAATQRPGSRTRARLHVEGRPQRVSRNLAIGFYAKRSHEIIVPSRCLVLHPSLETARLQLPLWLNRADGSGEASLALGHPEYEPRPVVLAFDCRGEATPSLFAALERAVASGGLRGAAIRHAGTERASLLGDPTPWAVGADGLPLQLAVGGFAQATETTNLQLVKRVAYWADAVMGQGERRVVELYAGAGNLTTLLARGALDYALVESDPEACAAARANMTARGLSARVVHASAEAFEWKTSARLLVVDPPRKGALEVMKRVAERPVRHVLYVSCDPSTLARDVAILIDRGYELRALEAFEMFPYTSHFESLAVLTRKR
jgi:23S rRNA (uracil1939-C5)-methyltransferase